MKVDRLREAFVKMDMEHKIQYVDLTVCAKKISHWSLQQKWTNRQWRGNVHQNSFFRVLWICFSRFCLCLCHSMYFLSRWNDLIFFAFFSVLFADFASTCRKVINVKRGETHFYVLSMQCSEDWLGKMKHFEAWKDENESANKCLFPVLPISISFPVSAKQLLNHEKTCRISITQQWPDWYSDNKHTPEAAHTWCTESCWRFPAIGDPDCIPIWYSEKVSFWCMFVESENIAREFARCSSSHPAVFFIALWNKLEVYIYVSWFFFFQMQMKMWKWFTFSCSGKFKVISAEKNKGTQQLMFLPFVSLSPVRDLVK